MRAGVAVAPGPGGGRVPGPGPEVGSGSGPGWPSGRLVEAPGAGDGLFAPVPWPAEWQDDRDSAVAAGPNSCHRQDVPDGEAAGAGRRSPGEVGLDGAP